MMQHVCDKQHTLESHNILISTATASNIFFFKSYQQFVSLYLSQKTWTHSIHGTGIFTYIYHKNSTIHVGKYTIPMDGMGEAP